MKNIFAHLLNAAVNGAAASVLSAGGAAAVGTPMEAKQIGVAALAGALIGTLRHLQQSPLIPTDEQPKQQ